MENILYEVIFKQAQVILNLENLSNAGVLDIQLAKQNDYDRQIQDLQDKKRVLYEQLLLQEISMEEYKSQKAAIDVELNRIKRLHAVLAAQTTQIKMDSEAKSARKKLAQDITSAGGLTTGLVETLIDRVYILSLIHIFWKKIGIFHHPAKPWTRQRSRRICLKSCKRLYIVFRTKKWR